MYTDVSVKYAEGIMLDRGNDSNPEMAASFVATMMQYGYIATKNLIDVLETLSKEQIGEVYGDVIPVLQKLKGADVEYNPMYPNFPEQVMNASSARLYMTAVAHYLSGGLWKPHTTKLPRELAFEDVKFRKIDLISEADFKAIFTRLVSSSDSISDADKGTISWFIGNVVVDIPSEIPFKENMCFVAGVLLKAGKDISAFVKTATDVLRIVTYLNDGDITLSENTKFKSLPRKQRRMFANLLDKVISAEDIKRHKNKWACLFHNLHVGEYSQNLYNIASFVRDNKHIKSFAGDVQKAVDAGNVTKAIGLLKHRPSEFARRVDHLLRLANGQKRTVVSSFLEVASDVPTRILLQLMGNLKVRHEDSDKKIVYPKGNAQKAIVVRTAVPKLSAQIINSLKRGIENVLENRFMALDPLNKVWIDPALSGCPLPTQQRSASEGTFQVARGTKLPIGDDKNTLRMFIYWAGDDIDLSATFHTESFESVGHVSFAQLRDEKLGTYHSGDITHASNGACEFIDVNIAKALSNGARYVAMNVLVYSGPTFAEHEKVYAGWMTRKKNKSNEVFEAKTVEQKIDLNSNVKNVLPVIFDLQERKAIWVDLATSWRTDIYTRRNTVEQTRASINEILEAIIDKNNKASLHELFTLHANARGEIVDNKEDADTVYGMYEGITPYNIDVINAEYVV